MALPDSSWKDFPDTGWSTGVYIIFHQGCQIDDGTHIPVPVAQSSKESNYNTACTVGMDLKVFRVFIREFLSKDPYIFPKVYPLIILDSKSDVCSANNGKDTKHTRNIYRRVHFVRNEEKCKMNKIDWCEGSLQLEEIETNNVGENNLIPGMKYIMVRLDN